MKETNTTAWFQSLEKALGKLAAIAAVVILLIFPLYVRDFYFDILNAKYQFYYITMLAVLIIAFIIFVFHVIQDFRYEDGKNVKVMFRSFSIKKMPLSHSFASIFLIVCIISTLQSQYLYESFWGNEGRYTGLFLLAIYVITFLFISRFLKLKKRYLNLFLVAGMLACIFGITDYFKLNLFHFKDELVAADWPVYTSTFGNINTYNAYVALVIGCCGALFIDAETKKEKIWYFICYLIASYSLITGGSDNAYLALLALFGFLPFWAFRTWKGVEKYFVMLSSFATITYIAGLIHNHMGNRVEILEGVFSVVIRSRLLVFAVAGLWLLTVILYVIEAAAKERIYKLGKLPVYIWTVLAAVIILAVGYVLYDANAGGHADKALAVPAQKLHIDARLHVKALGERGRDHMDEFFVAGHVLAQQDEVRVPLAVDVAAVKARMRRQIHLAADDRMDPLGLAGAVKVDHAVHDAMVGQRARGLPQLCHTVHQLFDTAGAVQQAVFAVDMQMCKWYQFSPPFPQAR